MVDRNPRYDDVASLLPLAEPGDAATKFSAVDVGFVYLARSGRFHKIGQTKHLGRRSYELQLQLPERLELIHAIRTDDPLGVERYWHDRFRDHRANGEWFKPGRGDVAAFKRWPDLA